MSKLLTAFVLVLSLSVSAADTKAAPAAAPGKDAPVAAPAAPAAMSATDVSNALYALGFNFGKRLNGDFSMSKGEMADVIKGMQDAHAGTKPRINPDEYQSKVQELATSRAKVKAEAEKKRSDEYLTKAAKEQGAQKFESGLIMFTLKAGTGASPAPTDTVSVHYKGTLVDGTEFDSSYKRGQPTEFPLNGVIKCWTEGVGKMKVGGKAKLVCPSKIAYGDMGAGGMIPGGATLNFEVELLSIKGK